MVKEPRPPAHGSIAKVWADDRGLAQRTTPSHCPGRDGKRAAVSGGLSGDSGKPRRSGLTRARQGPGAVAGRPGRPHCAGSEGNPSCWKRKTPAGKGAGRGKFGGFVARASSTRPSHGHSGRMCCGVGTALHGCVGAGVTGGAPVSNE